MFTELIKKEVANQVESYLKPFETIDQKVLRSQYKVLVFSSLADGTDLTPFFSINEILGKNLLIKSIRLVPWANGTTVDIRYSDGTTETIVNNTRIDRVFPIESFPNYFKLFLNGNLLPFFSTRINADMFIDNIYVDFKQKIQTIACQANLRIDIDMTGTAGTPNIKVIIECYSY